MKISNLPVLVSGQVGKRCFAPCSRGPACTLFTVHSKWYWLAGWMLVLPTWKLVRANCVFKQQFVLSHLLCTLVMAPSLGCLRVRWHWIPPYCLYTGHLLPRTQQKVNSCPPHLSASLVTLNMCTFPQGHIIRCVRSCFKELKGAYTPRFSKHAPSALGLCCLVIVLLSFFFNFGSITCTYGTNSKDKKEDREP